MISSFEVMINFFTGSYTGILRGFSDFKRLEFCLIRCFISLRYVFSSANLEGEAPTRPSPILRICESALHGYGCLRPCIRNNSIVHQEVTWALALSSVAPLSSAAAEGKRGDGTATRRGVVIEDCVAAVAASRLGRASTQQGQSRGKRVPNQGSEAGCARVA